MKIKLLPILLATSFILAGCPTTKHYLPMKQGVSFYNNLDELQSALAKRANEKINPGSRAADFQVFVTSTSEPIGTVYRAHSSIPALRANACKPSKLPDTVPAHYFTGNYTISKNLAMELGLDEAVFQNLAKLGANVKDSDTLTLSITDGKRQALDDQSLKALTGEPTCRAALKEMNFDGKTVWIVRGYIFGTRDFKVTRNTDIAANVGAEKIGKFKFEPVNTDATIVLKDEHNTDFLQIISEVEIKKEGDQTEPGSLTKVAAPSGGILGTNLYLTRGMTYIQMEEGDSSTAGIELINKLKELSWNVSSKVQRVEPTLMPKSSQIRYFHDADKVKADELQIALKATHPELTIVRLGIPAPTGQLEIWLTKS